MSHVSTWSSEVKNILIENNLSALYEANSAFNVRQIIDQLRSDFRSQQRRTLMEECEIKPKLRTFMLFKDFFQLPAYIWKPLSFYERRMLGKLRLGCLPLRIETGRYSKPRLPEAERVCLVCPSEINSPDISAKSLPSIESEFHFLFECEAYAFERAKWYLSMSLPIDFTDFTVEEKLKVVLNKPENLKHTSQFIIRSLEKRNLIVSNKTN